MGTFPYVDAGEAGPCVCFCNLEQHQSTSARDAPKGRFDEIFFVDLPAQKTEEILRFTLRRKTEAIWLSSTSKH